MLGRGPPCLTDLLLFNRSKGHGGDFTTALNGMHRYLLILVLSNTAHLPVQGQYTKPAQINSGTDTKTVQASMIEGQCAGDTPNTLIFIRLRNDSKPATISQS